MTDTCDIKKSDIFLKTALSLLVTLLLSFTAFAYGTLKERINNNEKTSSSAIDRVSSVEGDIKEIKADIKWLNDMRKEYQDMNKGSSLDTFIESIVSNKVR